MISTDLIKELREKTGAGISDIKHALEEGGGDTKKAEEIINRSLGGVAEKKSERTTKAGIIDAYIHSNARIGSLVELWCETDFVARNPGFRELTHGLAMHVAAMNPTYSSLDTIPPDVWDKQKTYYEREVKELKKPDEISIQIIEGKLKSYFSALSLYDQPYVKDQNKTVGDVIKEAVGRFGENIKVGQFVRFEI